MSKRRRQRKRYNDPYGRNRPLVSGQKRCQITWCNAAVWEQSLKITDSGKMACPNCYSDQFIRGVTKDWDIKISKWDIDQREVQ